MWSYSKRDMFALRIWVLPSLLCGAPYSVTDTMSSLTQKKTLPREGLRTLTTRTAAVILHCSDTLSLWWSNPNRYGRQQDAKILDTE
jgi:hypothetical protein